MFYWKLMGIPNTCWSGVRVRTCSVHVPTQLWKTLYVFMVYSTWIQQYLFLVKNYTGSIYSY